MLKFLQPSWLVVIQKESSDIVPKKEAFVVRDWTPWKAFDAVKYYVFKKKETSGDTWQILSMTRL